MAYFANGSEGMAFDDQCGKCRFGQDACPIALVQMVFNYKAVKNEVATAILNMLVKDDGTCEMFKLSKFFSIKEPFEEGTIVPPTPEMQNKIDELQRQIDDIRARRINP